MSRWNALPDVWKASFKQATEAYLNSGSVPIGAVVVDERGRIVARGRNGLAHDRLAHAEIEALSAIPSATDRSKCEIYCTLEPCLMCVGAIRLSQLRAVHCAALDPAAGGAEFFDANEFMRAFPCSMHAPSSPELELVVVALVAEFRHRTDHSRWREHWVRYHPIGAELGSALSKANAYHQWVSSSISAEQLYEQVAGLHRAA